MNEANRSFPHIELKFATEGTAFFQTFPRDKTPKTQANLGDSWGHGSKLKGSVSGIVSDWQDLVIERKKAQKPELPNAVPLILQIDPTAFDAEELRKYGIEVIAELEDGYIIGASADPQFTDLQKKIEQFINQERGGAKSQKFGISSMVRNDLNISLPQNCKHNGVKLKTIDYIP